MSKSSFAPSLQLHPKESEIVGRLLAGYGEIEFDVMSCLAGVMGDLRTAMQALFRLRSESQRLDVADAIMRPAFLTLSLGKEYDASYVATKRCKNIRNQYAHCHWIDNEGELMFTNLEQAAKDRDWGGSHQFISAELALLEAQEEYFSYAQGWLQWLRDELSVRNGGWKMNPRPTPKTIPPVPLNNFRGLPRNQGQAKADGTPQELPDEESGE